MKKQLYTLLLCTFLFGCTKTDPSVSTDKDLMFTFGINVEDLNIVQTKVDGSEHIDNINVLVFNENGYFISRHNATVVGDQFSVILPKSEKKRIVHFIANYDWTSFSDTQHVHMGENELLISLSTEGKPTFWNRYVLNNGIQNGSLEYIISLLRNYAKFSVENNTLGDTHIQNALFCIINTPNKGTVAPFDPTTASFSHGIATPHPESRLINTPFSTDQPIYTYESKVNTEDPNPFVIIQADYIDKNNSSTKKSFYKIEIQARNGTKLDIIRNNHYIVKINSVHTYGYSTQQQAEQNEASNSIDVSVELKDYTSISNGTSMLTVSESSINLTKTNVEYSFYYKFTPNLNSDIVDNSETKIELINSTTNGAIVKSSFQFSTLRDGKITFVTANTIPSDGSVFQSDIIISNKGLKKVIKVTLQAPASFQNLIVNPTTFNNSEGQNANLQFTLPSIDGIEFPIPIYITTNFNPDLNSESGRNLVLTAQNGQMKWMYMAQNIGSHKIDFITTTASAAHAITLESPYYSTTSVSVNTYNNEFIDVSIYRYGNNGENATFYFTIKNYYYGSIDIDVYTESMNYVSNPYNEKVTTITGGYKYHTNGYGNKQLEFTTKGNSQKKVIIESEGFKSISISIPKWN